MNDSASLEEMLATLASHTDLGHRLRSQAFVRQVRQACVCPGAASPHASGTAVAKMPLADALSFYRFMDDEGADIQALREARAQTALAGVPADHDILNIYDGSQLNFSSHNSKKDRRLIGDHRELGYEYACCLALDLTDERLLGVVHDCLVNADGPDDRAAMDYGYEPLFAHFSKAEQVRLRANHKHQMAVHIRGTAERLKPWHVIDVADREFDDIFILDSSRSANRDFVIRSKADRNVQMPCCKWIPDSARTLNRSHFPTPDGYTCVNLKHLIPHVPLPFRRELPLDRENRVVDPKNAARVAVLSTGAFKCRLYRPAKRNKTYVTPHRPVDLNVVVIRELTPPPDVTPVCWVLFTSLPADTPEQIAAIVRIYELRWRIERFFRLLKSGWHIHKSRYDSAAKLARYLVVVTLAAVAVNELARSLGFPLHGIPEPERYTQLKAAMLQPQAPQIPLNLRILAHILRLGGWLGRRRDPIGPLILMRGTLTFLAVLHDFITVAELLEEVAASPDALARLGVGRWARPPAPL